MKISNLISQANWFDKELSNCVVALEKVDSSRLVPHGTGFLMYNYDDPNLDYLVTCEHVIRNSEIVLRIPTTDEYRNYVKETGKGNYLTALTKRLWLYDGYNLISKYQLIDGITFIKNDSLDIAALQIELPGGLIYGSDTIKVTDRKSVPKSLIKTKQEIDLGTEVYFLGFPFAIGTNFGYVGSGIYSDYTANPLLRTGIVAWKAEYSDEFLLDAFSYSGNSGGPVFCKREVFGGTPYLIGMVIGHLGHPSIRADINIGLARCLWVDDIVRICERLK